MHKGRFNRIIQLVKAFALSHKRVLALGLCGSWARGTAREDSDIDLIFLVTDKQIFRETKWLTDLPFARISEKVVSSGDQIYGKVWSRHVILEGNSRIEFCFAETAWADPVNLDAGTHKVVSEGFKILYDPHRILEVLVKNVKVVTTSPD